ncbi:RNA-binding cell elongation regulator Jag/EloR [Amphibacillus xylanus]|uniref:RNA-binding protein KhpB n=1 Tax=Amphibacillus xylanus (strain ATCC 51415 / DSM 6626 / JCM 7361 / LMG 17667 / NBRC 15112 / Ep01) TaxID=698758 RepID=K0J0Y9_AMPXN|nr:RNA-binding cell elongation regulator Jag/EloR [Amphibacillus xylanus]BAM48540.1 Jag protein homolog [Amphibacillus xylanus NBRC 15112]
MKQVTASGQTVDDAVQSALEQLNARKDQVKVEIIDEGKKGMFGIFGAKRAIVKVSIKQDPIDLAKKYLEDITRSFADDINVDVVNKDEQVTFNLSGEKIAMVIGKRGQTLNAIQHLVQVMLNRQSSDFYRVIVDAEGYRARREETLQQLATRLADKAIKIRRNVTLEPMPSYERKIIHSILQDNPKVETHSDGTDPNRFVVIKPVNK